MYDIIFFDLDGTLLNDNKRISSYTFQTLLTVKSRKIELVLNSGRSLSSMKELANKYLVDLVRYFIANNGRVIYDRKLDEIYYIDHLDKNKMLQLQKSVTDEFTLFYASVDGIYTKKSTNPFHQTLIDEFNYEEYRHLPLSVNVVNDIEEIIKTKPIVRVYVHSSSEEALSALASSLPELFNNQRIHNHLESYCMYVGNPNSKALGLQKLNDMLGYKLNRSIAFGDADNDVEMIKEVGKGFSLCNGLEELKQVATDITEFSSNDDGVAIELQKLMRQGLI